MGYVGTVSMVVTYIVYPGRSYYGVKGRGYCTLAPAPVGGPKIKIPYALPIRRPSKTNWECGVGN